MHFQRRGKAQATPYKEEQNSSPMAGTSIRVPGQRSPNQTEKDTGENGFGELLYIDPNEINFQKSSLLSPATEGFQSRGRSPYVFGRSVLATVRYDLNERGDPTHGRRKTPLTTLTVNFGDKTREQVERSPKTINMGENEKEVEYNLRTLNPRKSPKSTNTNNQMYHDYINSPNEPGNIFLDQPLQGFSSNEVQYQAKSPNPREISPISREILYSMNPREIREPIPNIINKMSPDVNIGDESNSDIKGDTANQLKEIKTQMGRNVQFVDTDDDGVVEANHKIRNDIDTLEDYIKGKENKDTMNHGKIKKMMKQMVGGYDPHTGNEGRLISTSQTIIPGGNEELFNDRQRVLQKMNRLSTILLSKNRQHQLEFPEKNVEYQKKTFNRNTLNATVTGKNRRTSPNKSPQNRFLYLSLAMLSSKGLNCEDRIILRKMRLDKGGVVDLAQDSKSKKPKFHIKKIQRKSISGVTKGMTLNPKYREKAAKIIQGWWRDLKERYQKILRKIILIQSVWRGRWLRKYIYDIIYLSFLHQRFCDIIERIMISHIRPQVWEMLFPKDLWVKNVLAKLIEEHNDHFSVLRLKPFFRQWKNKSDLIKKRNFKSKKLIDMKEKELKKKWLLHKYFNEWNLKSQLAKFLSKGVESEKKIRNFYGVLGIMSGIDKLSKRSGLKSIKPKLKDYLSKKLKDTALRKILFKTEQLKLLILGKYFNKLKDKMPSYKVKDIRNRIFKNTGNRMENRINRINLKNSFNKWKKLIPRNKSKNFFLGAEKLKKFVYRTTYKDPHNALSQKVIYETERDAILRMFGVKSRYIKYHWRDYFDKWRRRAQKIGDKEIQRKMYYTLLNTILNKRKNRILSNRFNQWGKNSIVKVDSVFSKYKTLTNLLSKIVQKGLEPSEKEFINRIRKFKHPKAKKIAMQKMLERTVFKERNKLRYYFYKWRDQCKKMEILELKLEIFKYLCSINDRKQRRNQLSKTMNKWKFIVSGGKNNDYLINLRSINKGMEKLNKLKSSHEFYFIRRLYRNLNLDYRPKFLKKIINSISKPRGTVQDCFNKWRRVNDIIKSNNIIKNLKSKLLTINYKRLQDRIGREDKLKGLFKWKVKSKGDSDKYPKLTKGLNLMNLYCKKNFSKNPFDKIKQNKSNRKILLCLIADNEKIEDRVNYSDVKNRFNKWKKVINSDKFKGLKSNILLKTKKNITQIRNNRLLVEYFVRWKMSTPKEANLEFYKAIMLIKNFTQRPYSKDILKATKEKTIKNQKNKAIFTMFKTSKTFTHYLLRKAFYKWRLQTAKIDPKKAQKLKNKIRRFVISKDEKPLQKYFHKWIRTLAKNPDYSNIVLASDKLKKGIIKKLFTPIFKRFNTMISTNFIQKTILKKVLPNSNFAINRIMKNKFAKWKDKVDKINIKSLKLNLLSKVYAKEKGAVLFRRLKRYFDRWKRKEEQPKSIDLLNVVKGINEIHSVFANKYLKNLFSYIKGSGKRKFIRKVVFKYDLYHLRALEPFFYRWKNLLNKLKKRKLQYVISSKLMKVTTQSRLNEKIKSILTNKLSQWRQNVKTTKAKYYNVLNQAAKHLKQHNMITNGNKLFNSSNKFYQAKIKGNAVKAMPKIKDRIAKERLKKAFNKWNKKLGNFTIKDIKKNLIYTHLRRFALKRDPNLVKYFNRWRNKSYIPKSTKPIEQGISKLRNYAIYDSFIKLMKKLNMINLKIPRGISTKDALLKGKRNLAKSIALRICILGPFWRRWKEKTGSLKTKEIKRRLINKILTPKIKNTDKFIITKGFYNWRDKTNKLKAKENLQKARLKLTSIICDKTLKYQLMYYTQKWKIKISGFESKIKNIKTVITHIKKHATKPFFDKIHNQKTHKLKFERTNAILANTFRKNDKNNLYYIFNKWKNLSKKYNERLYKGRLLRNIANQQNIKSQNNLLQNLHKGLLRWKINATPKNPFTRMKNYNNGFRVLQRATRRPNHKDILRSLAGKTDDKLQSQLLNKLLRSLGPKGETILKKLTFTTWKDKVKETKILHNKLRKMAIDLMLSEKGHNKIYTNNVNDLVSGMEAYNNMKNNKAKKINDYCRSILKIKMQMTKIKRNMMLKKKFEKLNRYYHDKYNFIFYKWRGITRDDISNSTAKIMQRFLKDKLNRLREKRECVQNGAEILEKFVKRVPTRSITNDVRRFRRNNTLLKGVKRLENLNKILLKDKLLKWKGLLPSFYKNDAAKTIQNNFRNKKSRIKADKLRTRIDKIKYLTSKLFDKYIDKRTTYFHKWLIITEKEKCDKNAKIIQKYMKDIMNIYRKNKAKNNLNKIFKKYTLKRLYNAMKTASMIRSDRGEVLNKALENIFIRKPFNKLKIEMKWLPRIKKLNKVLPKIKEGLRKYWVPFYFNKWHNKVWDNYLNKIIRLQSWIKGKLQMYRIKKQLRKNKLISDIFTRLTNDKELKKKIPFGVWSAITKYEQLRDQANTIQKIWKGGMSRKRANKLVSQKKIKDILKKGFKNKIANVVNEAGLYTKTLKNSLNKINSNVENRYSTNNIIDYGNNELRNKYLYTLSGKLAFNNVLSNLRKYYDRWKYKGNKLDHVVMKLQNSFRNKKAWDKFKYLKKVKERMIRLVFKVGQDKELIVRCGFRKYLTQVRKKKCDDMARVIGRFIKPRLYKMVHKKFTNFFTSNALKIVKRKLNKEAKVKKLSDAIKKKVIKEFIKRLKNKDKYDKIKRIFIKKFHSIDEQLKKLYIQQNFKKWYKNSNKIKEVQNDSALKIQKNYKTYLATKKLKQIFNKAKYMKNIVYKMMNFKELLKKAGLNAWNSKVNQMKVKELSSILGDFMTDVKRKILNKNFLQNRNKLRNGFKKICKLKPDLKESFNKFKSHRNRKIFSKVIESLTKKRKDNLKTAFDNINAHYRENLLNIIFKIPDGLRKKILKNMISKWKDNSDKYAKKKGAETIQRNWKILLNSKISKKRQEIIQRRFIDLALRASNLFNYYFNVWIKNVKKIKLLNGSQKIEKFLLSKYKLSKARKNWNKLSILISLHTGNYAIVRILKRIRLFKAINKLSKSLKSNVQKNIFTKLKEVEKKSKVNNIYKLIFANYDKKFYILKWSRLFKEWKNKVNKYKLKESALNKALLKIDKRRKIMALDTMFSAILVKRLFKTIPKIRALTFFKKLKRKNKYVIRVNTTKSTLRGARKTLNNKAKKNFIQKVYKLFIYNKLRKMINVFENHQNMKIKQDASKTLIRKMLFNLKKHSTFNYNQKKSNKSNAKTTQFKFSKRVISPKIILLDKSKKDPIQKVLPYFITYLNKKIKDRKRQVLNKLIDNDKDGRFCSLYKRFNNKKMLPQKKEIVDNLKERHNFLNSKGDYVVNLFKLLRRKWIHFTTQSMKYPGKMFKIIYLIRISLLQQKIAKNKFIRELIRKWRFSNFIRKMARKKLELMYKNLHISYLQMANEVFGDEDEVNPSVIKEFERFGNSVGMFSGTESSSEEENLRRYYMKVQKKYVFKTVLENEMQRERKLFGEEEEVRDFYIEKDELRGTYGTYKEDPKIDKIPKK